MKKTLTLTLAVILFGTLPAAAHGGVIVGAERTEHWLPLLEGRRVALFSNHTGVVGGRHTVDVMLEKGLEVAAIFSPEHGFRGTADAGEHVAGGVDESTGIQIVSLYDGPGGKPLSERMSGFDVVVVDIQDVGLRFYTYYITMVKLMEACAECGIGMVVFDRPNPNGNYVDGPLLDMRYRSGVGRLPIPVVHGMTLGELARMTNGEGWLEGGRRCTLEVVECVGYTHRTHYRLPVPPSPNLPDMTAVWLYPSLCYFEATAVSVGRGTDKPFQIYGHPDMRGYKFSFTPRSVSGAKNPPQLGRLCHGVDLSDMDAGDIWRRGVDLSYVIDAWRNLGARKDFFTPFFEKLIGVEWVRTMIVEGRSADEISARWRGDVERFRAQRKPYLLYEE